MSCWYIIIIQLLMSPDNTKTYQLTKRQAIIHLSLHMLFPIFLFGVGIYCWRLNQGTITKIISIVAVFYGIYECIAIYTHWRHSQNMVITFNESTGEVTYKDKDDTFCFFLTDVAMLEHITSNTFGHYYGTLDYYVFTINRVHRTITVSSLLFISDIIKALEKMDSCRCSNDITPFHHIDD